MNNANNDEMIARVPDPMNLSHLTDLPQQIARGMRMADMTFNAITSGRDDGGREPGEPLPQKDSGSSGSSSPNGYNSPCSPVHVTRRSAATTLPATAYSSYPATPGKQSQEEDERRLDELWAILPPFSLSLVLEGNYYIHRLDLRWKRVYCDVRVIPNPNSCLLVWAGEWLVYEDEEEAGKWLRMWPVGGKR